MPIKDPEARREYERMRHQRDKVARNARNLAYKKRRRAEDAEFAERERARSRSLPAYVKRAHRLLPAALAKGAITRPGVCEECGAETYVEAAHSDYSQPLLVRWLCRSCHRRWDKDEPKVAA